MLYDKGPSVWTHGAFFRVTTTDGQVYRQDFHLDSMDAAAAMRHLAKVAIEIAGSIEASNVA